MAYDQTDEGGESDLRRRAAWLFAMLVVVAILIVVVFTTVLNTDGGGGGGDGNAVGPDAITSTGPASPTASTPTASAPSSRRVGTPTTGASTTKATGPTGCPSSAPCALSSDVGDAAAAINAFRAGQGKATIPVKVSDAASTCALNRGSGCSGGWAETEIPAPADGKLAVQKISQFAKLTDPSMTSIEIGWAFDPGSKTYYFATIRQD